MNNLKNKLKEKKGPIVHFWTNIRGFDRYSDSLPPIVRDTCEWLEKNALQTEGIFRISGNIQRMKKIKKLYEEGKEKEINLDEEDVHTIAGALKLFFLEPEEPILTSELYDAWFHAMKIDDLQSQIKCLANVLSRLPIGNKLIVTRLFRLLKAISKESEINKMTVSNLSIVFAPSLLRKPEQNATNILDDSEKAHVLISTMIENFDKIFVPTQKRTDQEENVNSLFYETLKKGSKLLLITQQTESEQKNDIQQICQLLSVKPEQVDWEMLENFYTIKKSRKNFSITSDSQLSQIYTCSSLLENTLDQLETNETQEVPALRDKLVRSLSFSETSLQDSETSRLINEYKQNEEKGLSSLDDVIERDQSKSHSLVRENSLQDAMNLLDTKAKACSSLYNPQQQ